MASPPPLQATSSFLHSDSIQTSVLLFELPALTTIFNVKKAWWQRLDLTFSGFSTTRALNILENSFREGHKEAWARSNRTTITLCVVLILLSGLYEHFQLQNASNFDMDKYGMNLDTVWYFRGLALLVGVGFIIWSLTESPYFQQHWGWLTCVALSLIGICFTTVGAMLGTLDQSYGLGSLLVLLTVESAFSGMRSTQVVVSGAVHICTYFTAVLATTSSVPYSGVLLLLGYCVYVRSAYSNEYHQRKDFIVDIKQANEAMRTSYLLSNMLPPSIITDLRLLKADEFIAHRHACADVLFCDIVSFTKLSASITPEAVVALLNAMFSVFDALTTKYDVYKVETIGDAYLACCGIFYRHPNHARCLVECALEMQQEVANILAPPPRWGPNHSYLPYDS